MLAPSAWAGQARIVQPGEKIDQLGVFIPADNAIQAADLLDRYNIIVERMKAADDLSASQMAQIELLEQMLGSSERELEIKNLIIQHKDEMLAFRKEINDEYKSLLAMNREQLVRDREAIERLEKMVENANKRSIWTSIIAFIIGAAASYFTFGIVH
jgi:septal ring factor EnvC (AmiA/AmiB activator)